MSSSSVGGPLGMEFGHREDICPKLILQRGLGYKQAVRGLFPFAVGRLRGGSSDSASLRLSEHPHPNLPP